MNVKPQMTWEDAVLTLRQDPQAQDLVRACFYDDPLIDACQRYWKSSEWMAIRELLPNPSGMALDVGAGRGIASFAFAKDGWTVTALEPDPSKLVGAGAISALNQEAGLGINVVREWGEQLPFEDAAFDIVHCRAVLHHARDLQTLCREVSRVLKPGGTFLATREHVVSRQADIPTFQSAHPLHPLYGGEYAYLLREYLEALRAARLEVKLVLNPLESDINLYPSTRKLVTDSWERRLRFSVPSWLHADLLKWRGALSRTPGRLYTFLATKPVGVHKDSAA